MHKNLKTFLLFFILCGLIAAACSFGAPGKTPTNAPTEANPATFQPTFSQVELALTDQAQTAQPELKETSTPTEPISKIALAVTAQAQTAEAQTAAAPTPVTKFALAITAQAQTATVAANQPTPTPISGPADVIYYNGQLLTMEKSQPSAQALAVKNGLILAVGSDTEILTLQDSHTRLVDLGGLTLTPGFIDSHGHRIGDRALYGSSATVDSVLQKTLAEGWTNIHELFVNPERLTEMQTLAAQNKLPLRVSMYLAVGYEYNYNPWYQSAAVSPLQQFSPFLQAAGIKITLDREWGQMVFFDQTQLNKMVTDATSAGWQVAIHAFSPAANAEALNAFGLALNGQSNQTLRLRLEHTGTMTDAEVQQMAQLGIIGSVQFINASLWTGDDSFKQYIPAEEVEHTARWRDMLNAGIFLIGNTDDPWCCTAWRGPAHAPYSASVVQSIYQGVTRQNFGGVAPEAWQVAQTVTVHEALEMLTINGAYAGHQETSLGSLKAGKLADLVILSANPLSTPIEQIPDTTVVMTMVGGQVKYCAPGHETICAK